MRGSWMVLLIGSAFALLSVSPAASTVLFSETGTPDLSWSDDGDLNDWMIGHTEQDVIDAGWSGTGAEAAWQLDPWRNPGNRVLAVKLLKLSADKSDAQDSVVSSPWRDTVGRVSVPWTAFCNVALLYEVEPGHSETARLDLKAHGMIVDSVAVEMSGNGFSNWIFMAGSVHEAVPDVSISNWRTQVSLTHLTHARSVTVMVDDIFVYESEDIGFIVGRTPNQSLTPAVQSGADTSPIPLPTISAGSAGGVSLTWRSTEGYAYDVERSVSQSFGWKGWEKIAEGLPQDPSGVMTFQDDGPKESRASYYRLIVHAP